MAISNVQVRKATPVDGGATISLAFASNVTAGNIIHVTAVNSVASNDPFVAGDCTQSAGTATLGSITLDRGHNHNPSGSDRNLTGIWSAQVTGSGSLTMQVAGTSASSFLLMFIDEFHTDTAGASIVVDSAIGADTDSGAGSSTSPDSGSVTPANPGLLIGLLSVYTGNNQAITQDAAFSLIGEEENGVTHAVGSAIYRVMTGGSDSASWTISSHPWSAMVQGYKELVAGTVTMDMWMGRQEERLGVKTQVVPSGTIAIQA